jgi:RNA polymerase sigma factor (sigma-70 family)
MPKHPPLKASEPPLEHYHQGLYRYLLRRLKGAVDAEDLAQVIYLRFLQSPNLANICHPQAYLYRIAANVLNEYMLRRKTERIAFDSSLAEELTEHPAELGVDEASEEIYSGQLFQRVLRELPATHRAALVLFAQEGLDLEEIGTRLEVNPQTVRKYLRQALARYRTADRTR